MYPNHGDQGEHGEHGEHGDHGDHGDHSSDAGYDHDHDTDHEDGDFEDLDDLDNDTDACPDCGDDSGSCRCFIVLSWEGIWLYDQWDPLDKSSLDRVLNWGHPLSLAGAPPSRTCPLLARLPEALAEDIESYWLQVSTLLDPKALDAFRAEFLKSCGQDCASDDSVELDPSDSRHPHHEAYLDDLDAKFGDRATDDWSLRERRISVHCTWASICCSETNGTRHRTGGVGTSSVWASLNSDNPPDTWRRMEAMLEPVLKTLDGLA